MAAPPTQTDRADPQRLRRRTRWAVGTLVGLVVAASSTIAFYQQARAELALAGSQLATGDLTAARETFERYRPIPRLRREAEVGLALTRILEEPQATSTSAQVSRPASVPMMLAVAVPAASLVQPLPPTASEVERFHLPQLLRTALETNRPEAVLSLLDLVPEAGPPWDLFARAAHVSLGRAGRPGDRIAVPDSAPRADRPPRALASRPSGFERRVRSTEDALQRASSGEQETGPILLLRDRRGRLLGTATDEGLRLEEGLADLGLGAWLYSPPLIPAELLERARSQSEERPVSLRLSLDLELQRLARAAVGDEHGTVVLLDPESGELLAAVSDADTLSEPPRDRARRRRRHRRPAPQMPITDLAPEVWPAFLLDRREPASISKLVTTTAALRAGIDPDEVMSRDPCYGSLRLDTGILWCPIAPRDVSGLNHALAISCNTSFARLGLEVGRDRLLEELGRYGFVPFVEDPAEVDPYTTTARVRDPVVTSRRMGDLSIGLEATEIAPLHAARFAAVFTDGQLRDARLVLSVDDALGLAHGPMPSTGAGATRVVDEAWLPRLREAMEAVLEPRGTGRHLEPEGFDVAMKTGTAAEPGLGYHVNYVGYAPVDDPQWAFAVRVTDQRTSRRIRRSARAVTRRLFESLAER